MMASYGVNSSVNEENCKIHYDIDSSDLKDLKKGNFSFQISSTAGDKALGVFQAVSNDGTLLRQNESKPFPKGTFTKASTEIRGNQFIVKVKKSSKDVNLREYFEN